MLIVIDSCCANGKGLVLVLFYLSILCCFKLYGDEVSSFLIHATLKLMTTINQKVCQTGENKQTILLQRLSFAYKCVSIIGF